MTAAATTTTSSEIQTENSYNCKKQQQQHQQEHGHLESWAKFVEQQKQILNPWSKQVTVGTLVLDVVNATIGRPEVGGGRPPRLFSHAAHLRVGVVRRRAALIKCRLDLKIKLIVS